MIFTVYRLPAGKDATVGALVAPVGGSPQLLCYTLEDLPHEVKVAGETRIPAGLYRLAIQREGELHKQYAMKFGAFHKGMIVLQEVPNYACVMIHIGNSAIDTRGCLLLGDGIGNPTISTGRILAESANAYRRVYPLIVDAILKEETSILILDFKAGR